jgi:hypothetical protein
METDAQPTNPKPKRRWYRYRPHVLVMLAGILLFYFVDRWILPDYCASVGR